VTMDEPLFSRNRPPRTYEELRELIDRLADPEEMSQWLEEILNPCPKKQQSSETLSDTSAV